MPSVKETMDALQKTEDELREQQAYAAADVLKIARYHIITGGTHLTCFARLLARLDEEYGQIAMLSSHDVLKADLKLVGHDEAWHHIETLKDQLRWWMTRPGSHFYPTHRKPWERLWARLMMRWPLWMDGWRIRRKPPLIVVNDEEFLCGPKL